MRARPWWISGCAFAHRFAPVVEYRVWPMAHAARERLQLLLVEDLRDEAHVADDREPSLIGDRDPADSCPRCWSAKRPKYDEPRDVAFLRADPEDAAHG